MLIGELLRNKGNKVFTVRADATAQEALRQLKMKHIGCLVVMSPKNEMEGIISERDILYNMEACISGNDVRDFMTPKDKIVIGHEDDTLEYAMSVFTNNRIRHIPIIDDGKITGIVSIGDVVKTLLDTVKFENKVLKDYIAGGYPVLS